MHAEHDYPVAKIAEVSDAIGDHHPVKLKVEHHHVGEPSGTGKDGLDRVAGRDDFYPAARIGCEPATYAFDDDVGVFDERDTDGPVQRA